MVATLTVIGEPRLVETLASAQKQVTDLDLSEAARLIANRAALIAPRRTGRLAASVTAQGKNTITSPLVYAVPIHWGRPAHNITANPFVDRAFDQAGGEWGLAVDRAVQKVLDGVHGA